MSFVKAVDFLADSVVFFGAVACCDFFGVSSFAVMRRTVVVAFCFALPFCAIFSPKLKSLFSQTVKYSVADEWVAWQVTDDALQWQV